MSPSDVKDVIVRRSSIPRSLLLIYIYLKLATVSLTPCFVTVCTFALFARCF